MSLSEYEIDFFKTEDFIRQKCSKCGKYFWARTERELCGESPCIEYSFIGNPLTKEKLSLHETREKFLSFFERNDHTRINRYPITARWRDDVFFTQASIYGFQPWVINGVVEPPANPLTISQTCVRFNDIDNVGRTGSHLTMFEMMAHHVFNKKDKFIYFKDRTVELCDRLMREDFGIQGDEITYIEADWKGGGNSGPCFEVIAGGVELATLVFMMYEESGGVKRPLNMQVVDTGYGLERLTWVTQGTSSAYEAVFGPVLQKLKDTSGFKGDSKVLSEYSKVAGLLNIDNPGSLKELKSQVAQRLDLSIEQLETETGPMENIYVICDHTRALTFMLNDGIVPSNVKAGYFARLLVRRATRAMKVLGLELPLVEIVADHIDYFKDDFPELSENRTGILELVEVEARKYEETLKKGSVLVDRMESKLAITGKMKTGIGIAGKTRFDIDDLVELYDSHGLNPEVVKEFASHDFDIPDDFYQQVAARHEAQVKTGGVVVKKSVDAPPTVLGFYEDPHIQDFNAKVLHVDGKIVVLDKTYFYAEGGGQECDTGEIAGQKVVDVQAEGQVLLHYMEKIDHGITKGQEVTAKIDWTRRHQLMRHHTATHLINAAAREVLGNHIWQTGAHKSVDLARLDITHYAGLTEEQFIAIEEKANEYVMADIPVDTYVMNRGEAEKKHGFRLYQGGAVPGRDIRIIDVKGVDVEACGGIHCTRTTEVGPIKLLRSKRIQDGVVRLEFVAGRDTVAKKEKELEEQDRIEKERTEKKKSDIRAQKDARRQAKDVVESPEEEEIIENVFFRYYNKPGSISQAQEVSKNVSKSPLNIFSVITDSENYSSMLLTCTASYEGKNNCSDIADRLKLEFDTVGGGKKDFAQVAIPNKDPEIAKKMKKRALELAKEA